MPRRPTSFRQSDVTRAIQGARAAGERVRQVEIDSTGKIVVIVGATEDSVGKLAQTESWDKVS